MSMKKMKIGESWRLVHFVRLAITLLKDEESARDNHVLACSFAKNIRKIIEVKSQSVQTLA